jgi:hypothetical protein
MSEEKSEGGSRGTPTSNTLLADNINLSETSSPMTLIPVKVKDHQYHTSEKNLFSISSMDLAYFQEN